MGKLNIFITGFGDGFRPFAVVFKQNQSRLHFIELDKAQKRESVGTGLRALEAGAGKIGKPQTD